MVMTKWKQPL